VLKDQGAPGRSGVSRDRGQCLQQSFADLKRAAAAHAGSATAAKPAAKGRSVRGSKPRVAKAGAAARRREAAAA